jgi:hypothetical protein
LTKYKKEKKMNKFPEGTAQKEKDEYYSTGASLKDPEKIWPNPIVEYPTDFSDCIKGGRFWDWQAIRGLYARIYPAISLDQVKRHLKIKNVYIKFPYIVDEPPKLEDYPKDFSDAIEGNKWNYDKIAELYGLPIQEAVAHFRTLKVSPTAPKLGAKYVTLLGETLFGPTASGEIRLEIPEEKPEHVLTEQRKPSNPIVDKFLECNKATDVFWAFYGIKGICYDIIK